MREREVNVQLAAGEVDVIRGDRTCRGVPGGAGAGPPLALHFRSNLHYKGRFFDPCTTFHKTRKPRLGRGLQERVKGVEPSTFTLAT